MAFVTGCADAVIGVHAATDRSSVYDDMWRNVDLHYSFLEYKQIDWTALGARYRPLALAATDDQGFALVMGQLLNELHDVHVALTPSGEGSTLRYVSRFETLEPLFDPSATVGRYVSDARMLADGRIIYGMATPGVGYVRITSFAGNGWSGDIDRALDAMPAARHLILDIRSNRGGTRALAIDVAGRFVDRPQTFGYLRLRNGPAHGDFTDYIPETVSPTGAHRFTGNIWLLTDRRVVSASEQFILALRTMASVTVVGDTTGGASGGPIVRELANGWTYQLSEWIEYTADRRIFEGVGLPPDDAVAATTASALGDPVLERALALARE